MRTALALLVLLAAPALASPPVTPAGKPAKDAKVEPKVARPDAKKKVEPAKLDARDGKQAGTLASTLTLAPKKKPHRVALPDWTP